MFTLYASILVVALLIWRAILPGAWGSERRLAFAVVVLAVAHFALSNIALYMAFGLGEGSPPTIYRVIGWFFGIAYHILLLPFGWFVLATPLHLSTPEEFYVPIRIINSLVAAMLIMWILAKRREKQ